ncbi:hypothetical protein DRO38_00200 [Candidatus Bathyarchaeota archaeon]|nr:MAG: hypothetical protein DRO38_00200 [Candidatus Bathyarchaeota archaeon]
MSRIFIPSLNIRERMKLSDQEIARMTFNREKKQILEITILRKDFRFKCQRCAVFCCKLGGPIVNKLDLKRLAKTGLNPSEFIEPVRRHHDQQGDAIGVLKQKDDGSCIFLKYDASTGLYECGIYEARPNVCRLYPFEFILEGNEKGVLRVIPCCNGLNAPNGRLVDREFIRKHLLDAIREIL